MKTKEGQSFTAKEGRMKYPTITAVMVTLGRMDLIQESYACFKKQTYPSKKMLVVTDCSKNGHDALKSLVRKDKELLVLHLKDKKTLGELRNLSIEYAPSNLSIQWDDDDWYSPTRMMDQFKGLQKGYKAVMLKEQLHYFRDTKQVGWTVDKHGIEGTLLLDRRCGVQYPSERRGEDTVLKKALRRKGLLGLVKGGICYCRTYHGNNTWDRKHHIQRIREIGKTEAEMNKNKLKEAALLYNWEEGWEPIYGEEV